MADFTQSILRQLKDIYENPRLHLERTGDTLRNKFSGLEAVIRPEGVGMRKMTPKQQEQAAVQAVLDNLGGGGMGALGIIKNKGGNWLTGSVEDALKPLKRTLANPEAITPEMLASNNPAINREYQRRVNDQAINKWIEGPLTRYVKRDMATEGDPVRRLAEQGILHTPMEYNGVSSRAYGPRQAFNNQPYGVAESDLAKAWENISDASVGISKASEYQLPKISQIDTFNGDPVYGSANKKYLIHRAGEGYPYKVEMPGGMRGDSSPTLEGAMENMRRAHRDLVPELRENPWMENLPPEESLYGLSSTRARDLGFPHLIDELSNALNPESGLPRNLLLNPEDFQQMGMERAVRHVDAINKFRQAAMEQAKLKELETSGAMGKVYKEYPENNPMGMVWKEIANIDKAPEGRVIKKGDGYVAVDANGNEIAQRLPNGDVVPPKPQPTPELAYLQGQLTTEGNIMGHCVGGYCDPVASGDTRIFSLRDAKGEPHVTIETGVERPSNKFSDVWDEAMKYVDEDSPGWSSFGEDDPYDVLKSTYGSYVEDPVSTVKSILSNFPEAEKAAASYGANPLPERIIQIKGKQNRAPNPEYLPFVQDFVKSGKWSDVGDLSNTGLIPVGRLTSANTPAKSFLDDLLRLYPKMETPPQGMGSIPEYELLQGLLKNMPGEYASEADIKAYLGGMSPFEPTARYRKFASGGLVSNYQRPLPESAMPGIISNYQP